MTDTIRILVVDDQPIFREGVKALLGSIDQMDVIGEACDGREGVVQAQKLVPDIVLMDLKMPGISGIEATRIITDALPQVGIIALTMYKDDASVFAAMRAGARGYLLKGADQDEMVRAIRAVMNGNAIFATDVAQKLMTYFSIPRTMRADDLFPQLTSREIEVLQLLTDELSNKEIAAELVISPKTVRNHLSSIYRKLQVSDRIEAARLARDAGLDSDNA
jgi:DNA-binding NarL/FixJ family response regulator